MCNEDELLERFNIQLAPIPMTELTEAVKAAKQDAREVEQVMAYMRERTGDPDYGRAKTWRH